KDCPNGFLEKKELIKSFQKLYPNGKPDKICSKLFNAFDQDKNNRIDFVEYLLGISHLSSLDIKKKLQLTFRIYDHHNKGKVSRKEMEKMIVAIFDLNGVKERSGENDPREKAMNIFKRFNKKNNDYLNEEEFIDGCIVDDYLIDLFAEYRI
ncbi:Neuronal calcium sensor 2, partial [Brachionus plicatilis]